MNVNKIRRMLSDAEQELGMKSPSAIIPVPNNGFGTFLADTYEEVKAIMIVLTKEVPEIHIINKIQHIQFNYKENKGWSYKIHEGEIK